MKYLILIFGIVLLSTTTRAQTVLLNVNPDSQTKISERGPNLKNFSHLFFHFGMLASADKPGAEIIYGNSVNLAIGFRKKFKITPAYSLGFETGIQYTDYKLKQEEGKTLPDTVINNISGRMDYSSLSLGVFNRFNFDPQRGNFLGSFLDVGIMGMWHYSIKSISKNELSDGTTLKNILKNLPYVNQFESKVFARIGFSHFSVYGTYRITDLFTASSNYPDLPRLIMGMEFAIF